MKLFLYEFITGGGLLSDEAPPSGSLLAEGWAMLSALAEDASRIDNVDVSLILDDRLHKHLRTDCDVVYVHDSASERSAFAKLAAESDATVVIAPELDGILLDRTEAVLAAGGRLVSCAPDTVRITADKQRTAELLGAAGVAVPSGCTIDAGEPLPRDFAYPAILKPNDGAGSHSIRRIDSAVELPQEDATDRWRLEHYCRGTATSCSVLCGPAQRVSLAPCFQDLACDGSYVYVGGRTVRDASLVDRARALAELAVAALPNARGYIGVDLLLGDQADGSRDMVIEINPRLTTSYVGLRRTTNQNLAEAMLDIAIGKHSNIESAGTSVEFLADGTILRSEKPTTNGMPQ